MLVQSKAMMNISESDLRFLVESVAISRRDYDHIVNLIRGKEDLLEPMLEDPKLLERLFHDQETFILSAANVLEPDSKGKRIPVFEAPAVAEMLSHKRTRVYLAEILSSFARTTLLLAVPET